MYSNDILRMGMVAQEKQVSAIGKYQMCSNVKASYIQLLHLLAFPLSRLSCGQFP